MDAPNTATQPNELSKDAPLDFETWAALSARLVNLDADERIDILNRRGVELDDWSLSDEHHLRSLSADISAGRWERAERYGRMCAAEMERRAKGEPEEPAPPVEVATAAEAPEVPAPMPVLAIGAPAVGGGEEVLSFLHAGASLDAMRAEPSPLMPRSPGPSPLAGTMKAPDLPSFVREASANPLPFGETPSPEFLASLNAPKPPAPTAPGMTLPVGASLRAHLGSTLPFAKVDTEAVSKQSPVARVVSFPRLPLEAYASLCAELRVFADRQAEVLAKYGIRDDEAQRALDDDWRARLTAHPDTREEWRQLCERYEAWLRKAPR